MTATIGPFAAGNQLVLKDEGEELESGEEEITTLAVPSTGMDLKITLVWTDPPGEALHDLDLIVRASNGKERHGNMTAKSRMFDRVNYLEQVVWATSPSATWTSSYELGGLPDRLRVTPWRRGWLNHLSQ